MDFGTVTRRPIRFFELADQSWFPAYIRGKIQEILTKFWTRRLPLIQTATPAELAAAVVSDAVNDIEKNRASEVVVVDFCSGGGGPIPTIETIINADRSRYNLKPLRFILTDLYPHVEAWRALKAKSSQIEYITKSVDACNAPPEVITGNFQQARIFRLFCLSFHHFDDRLAKRILDDSMEKSDGFAIIELQSRTVSTMILMALYLPTILLMTPFWAPADLGLFFFTYVVPIVPFALVFDGVVSALRTRTFEEVLRLIDDNDTRRNGYGKDGNVDNDWVFEAGWKMHTWPIGYMNWIVGKRRG